MMRRRCCVSSFSNCYFSDKMNQSRLIQYKNSYFLLSIFKNRLKWIKNPSLHDSLMYYQNGDLTNLLKSTRKWSAPECPFEWRGKQSLFGQCPIRGLLCFNGASLKERNHWKLTWKVLKWRPIGHLNSISLINAAFLICTETLAFWPWWSPLPPKSWSTRYNASLKKNCDWSEIKFCGRFGGQFAILEEELKEDLKSDKMFTFVELYWIQQVLVSSINGDIVL